MDPDNSTPRYTFVFGSPETQHTTTVKFPDDIMAKDYARRKLREHHGEKGWTTVAVGVGVGDDVRFIGAWDRAEDGAMTWTPDD